MLEAMQKKQAHEPFLAELSRWLAGVPDEEAALVKEAVAQTLKRLASLDFESAQWAAKAAATRLADAATVALLFDLSRTAGERYRLLARLYARRFLAGEPYPEWVLKTPEVFAQGVGHA